MEVKEDIKMKVSELRFNLWLVEDFKLYCVLRQNLLQIEYLLKMINEKDFIEMNNKINEVLIKGENIK